MTIDSPPKPTINPYKHYVLLCTGQRCGQEGAGQALYDSLCVASRMIVRTLRKQMRMRSVPIFHGPHWGFAFERRLG